MNHLYLSGAKSAKEYLLSFCKWSAIALVSGGLCGLAGVAFHYAVDWATELRLGYPWLLFFLPAAGLLIVWLYQKAGMGADKGTNMILDSVHQGEKPPLRLAVLIFVSTALTHLCGGSSGREGAALQIGGSLGNALASRLRLSEKGHTMLIMCGMSGLFSALFGTPLTATIFSIEVISVGILHYSALLPCLLSALVAYEISVALGVIPTAFPLLGLPEHSLLNLARVAGLALVCALVSILFCVCMHQAGHWYKRLLKNPYLRVAVGAVLVIGLTLLCGTRDYNGAGMDVVARALAGQGRPEAFLLKILFTALTLGAGFKGGEIVPSFFIGATLGCAVGPLLGLDPAFAAAIGLVAVFCGVVNCPMASLVLSMELFGGSGMLLFALACAVSYLMSGPFSLYSSQKLVYSKLEPTFVNSKTL